MLSQQQSQSLIDALEEELSSGGRRRRRRRRKRVALQESIFSKWNNHRVDYKVDGNIGNHPQVIVIIIIGGGGTLTAIIIGISVVRCYRYYTAVNDILP